MILAKKNIHTKTTHKSGKNGPVIRRIGSNAIQINGKLLKILFSKFFIKDRLKFNILV